MVMGWSYDQSMTTHDHFLRTTPRTFSWGSTPLGARRPRRSKMIMMNTARQHVFCYIHLIESSVSICSELVIYSSARKWYAIYCRIIPFAGLHALARLRARHVEPRVRNGALERSWLGASSAHETCLVLVCSFKSRCSSAIDCFAM